MLAQLSPSLSSAVHCVGEIGFYRCTQALLNCAASETRFEGVTFFLKEGGLSRAYLFGQLITAVPGCVWVCLAASWRRNALHV